MIVAVSAGTPDKNNENISARNDRAIAGSVGPYKQQAPGNSRGLCQSQRDQFWFKDLLAHLTQCPADDGTVLVAALIDGALALRQALVIAVVRPGLAGEAVQRLGELVVLDEEFFALASFSGRA